MNNDDGKNPLTLLDTPDVTDFGWGETGVTNDYALTTSQDETAPQKIEKGLLREEDARLGEWLDYKCFWLNFFRVTFHK